MSLKLNSNNIIYSIYEFSSKDEILSVYKTKDSFNALSSLLMRSLHPVNTEVARQASLAKTKSKIIRQIKPISHELYIKILMKTFNDQDELFCYSLLDTEYSDDGCELGYSQENTEDFYFMAGYNEAINILTNRLKKYTENNISVAQILTKFASEDLDHIFWERNYSWTY